MPYNVVVDSFHTKKLPSRLSSRIAILDGKRPFCVFEPPSRRRETYDVHLRLIGKRVVDFLLVLI